VTPYWDFLSTQADITSLERKMGGSNCLDRRSVDRVSVDRLQLARPNAGQTA